MEQQIIEAGKSLLAASNEVRHNALHFPHTYSPVGCTSYVFVPCTHLQGDLAAIAKTLEFLEGVDLTPELSMVQQRCFLSHAGYSYWLRRKFVS